MLAPTIQAWIQPAMTKPDVMLVSLPAPLTSDISVSHCSWVVTWVNPEFASE
jgi:hypothetical protein